MSALRVLLALLTFVAAGQPNRNQFHYVADVSASDAAQTSASTRSVSVPGATTSSATTSARHTRWHLSA